MGQSNDQVPVASNLSFESLKKLNHHGIEYWSARDLRSCLGYTEWRKFENIPPAEPIKKVEQRLKDTKPHLIIDPKDALGRENS